MRTKEPVSCGQSKSEIFITCQEITSRQLDKQMQTKKTKKLVHISKNLLGTFTGCAVQA